MKSHFNIPVFLFIFLTTSIIITISSSAELVEARLSFIWRTTLSIQTFATFTQPTVAPSGNTVLVGSKTESLVAAVDANTGTELWRLTSVGKVKVSPSICCPNPSKTSSCVALIPARDLRKFIIANLSTSTEIVSHTVTSFTDTTPAAVVVNENVDNDPGTLVLLTLFGSSQQFTVFADNTTFTLDGTNTGTISNIWNKNIQTRPSSVAVSINNAEFGISNSIGNFYLLRATDGNQLWQQTLGAEASSTPTAILDPVHGRILAICTTGGRLLILNSNNGNIIYNVFISTTTGGITSISGQEKIRMVIVGDSDGTLHGVSLVDGVKKFSRSILANTPIISLTNLTLDDSTSGVSGVNQESLVRSKLGIFSSPSSTIVGLVAGVVSRKFFIASFTTSSVSNQQDISEAIVFSEQPSTNVDGGLTAVSTNTKCIFIAQFGRISCINATDIYSQLHPSDYNAGASSTDSIGLEPAAQIAIIVVCSVVGAVLCGLLLYFVGSKMKEEMEKDNEQHTLHRNPQQTHHLRTEEEIRNQRALHFAHHQNGNNNNVPITAGVLVLPLQQQQQQQRAEGRNTNNMGIFQEMTEKQIASETSSSNDNINNNNNSPTSNALTNAVVSASSAAASSSTEQNTALRHDSSSGTFVTNSVSKQRIFQDRNEMLSTKLEQTPCCEVDWSTLRFLTEDFSTPFLQTRNITELELVICPQLNCDVLELYSATLAYAGKLQELLVCKISLSTSTSSSSSRNVFEIPPTLHSILGFTQPNNHNICYIVVDTESLLHAASASSDNNATVRNPLNDHDNNDSSSSQHQHRHHHHHHHQKQESLLQIWQNMKQQLETKSFTCSVCYDTIEIRRSLQTAALLPGAVCSTLEQFPAHFTCSTCLSGSVEKSLEDGDYSLNVIPCYDSACVSLRQQIELQQNQNQQQSSLPSPPSPSASSSLSTDVSGYFIFEDFSCCLKPTTLRKWQKSSQEAARVAGQKEVMSAMSSSASASTSNTSTNTSTTEAVRRHCNNIRSLLRARCPHCGMEFASFTACLTVTCAIRNANTGALVAGCNKTFCGACMTPRPCPGNHGHDYMNTNQIFQHWKVWRHQKISSYLSDHFSNWKNNNETRKLLERVLRTSVQDFVACGIWPLSKPWSDVIAL